ncbi:hypothetical protein U1Q18_030400 [Sarracenia purpurea var. burkii]
MDGVPTFIWFVTGAGVAFLYANLSSTMSQGTSRIWEVASWVAVVSIPVSEPLKAVFPSTLVSYSATIQS